MRKTLCILFFMWSFMSEELLEQLEIIPYFTVLGLLTLIFQVVFCFSFDTLPVYMTEVLAFVIIGLELHDDYNRNAANLGFYVILLWFGQALVDWLIVPPTERGFLAWGLCILQVYVSYKYFSVRDHGGNERDLLLAGIYMLGMVAQATM